MSILWCLRSYEISYELIMCPLWSNNLWHKKHENDSKLHLTDSKNRSGKLRKRNKSL